MKCILPDLSEDENSRVLQILQETHLLGEKELSPEICSIQTSRKNIVLSIHPDEADAIVVKLFNSSKSLRNELKIYKMLKPSIFFESVFPYPIQYAIPELLHHGEDYIITKHINGFNGMDIVTQHIEKEWNPAFWEQICSDIIQWILNFSEKTHYLPLDCHVRNFLMLESTIFGVDFEELGVDSQENLLRVFATLYFSILGAYPGVVEGLKLQQKADIGVIFLRILLLTPQFQELSMKELITNFLMYLQEEAATVIQRRLNLNRGRGYNTLKIKENLDFVMTQIQSEFT